MREIHDLASKAASQHGLLTSEQVLSTGRSRHEVGRLVELGVLIRTAPGVLRLPGAPATWQQQLLAACLAPGPTTAASHRSALRLWGMRTVDDEIEVSVRYPYNRRAGADVVVHRSKDLVRADITWVDGIPTTEPVRTICDAGAVFPDHEVRRILDHAIATDVVTRADMWRFRRRVGRQGRCGVGPLHRSLEALPIGAERTESGPELHLLSLCEQAGLPIPIPQLPVRVGRRDYRLDLAYPGPRIALEYDGYDVHTGRTRFVEDRRRQNDLVLAGWTVLRFTSDDLRHHPGRVIRKIRDALSAHPDFFDS